uniref:Uncharacterized protein n=1 Tax=Romanomermis culicivorax TaxID=13658 RepID=A0A915KRT7_ROMCU
MCNVYGTTVFDSTDILLSLLKKGNSSCVMRDGRRVGVALLGSILISRPCILTLSGKSLIKNSQTHWKK